MFEVFDLLLPKVLFEVTTRDLLCAVFVMLLVVFYNQHRIGKRLLKLEAEPPTMVENESGFVTITPTEVEKLRPIGREYLPPKVFPQHLNKYIKRFSLSEVSRWVLDISNMVDVDARREAQRAVTISAILHRIAIPKHLVLIDYRTKSLWTRLKFDLELKRITERHLEERRTSYEEFEDLTLRSYLEYLVTIGSLICRYSQRCDFPSFDNFAQIFSEQRKPSKLGKIDDRAIRALATTYAVKTGVKIPASYVSYDYLALALIKFGRPKTPEPMTEVTTA